MHIRAREPDDIDNLVIIAQHVHERDGYPPYLPDGDYAGFISSAEAIDAWVATIDDQLVGQVSLHTRSSRAVMALAVRDLDIPKEEIAVVARLLVHPEHRRMGVAQSLLRTAVSHAERLALVPILDVVDRFTPAIGLYEREGWRRLGTVEVELPDGTSFTEHVYAAPTIERVSTPPERV